MLPFVLMRRDVARGTERCIGVGHIYDQYEEAKQPLERRKLHRTFRKVVLASFLAPDTPKNGDFGRFSDQPLGHKIGRGTFL